MSTATRWTLIGMQEYETTLFDTLELPEGYDKQTFIDSLLLEHGEKCVLYTDPDFMKYSIGIWSRKWRLELTRIYEALTAEYNPLYNYDRFEEISDGETHTFSRQENGGRTATDNPDYSTTTEGNNTESTNTSGEQTTNQERDRETEHKISADNSSSYAPEWQETTNDGKTKQENESSTRINGANNSTTRLSGTTQNVSESDNRTTNDTESRNNTHTAHIYGNIGVVTSTKMVSEVTQQRADKNLYDITTRLFANELLIPIY